MTAFSPRSFYTAPLSCPQTRQNWNFHPAVINGLPSTKYRAATCDYCPNWLMLERQKIVLNARYSSLNPKRMSSNSLFDPIKSPKPRKWRIYYQWNRETGFFLLFLQKWLKLLTPTRTNQNFHPTAINDLPFRAATNDDFHNLKKAENCLKCPIQFPKSQAGVFK